MAWIESHTVLGRHRKVLVLAQVLGADPVHIVGHLHVLWHTILEQQEDGDLSAWPESLIAQAAGWKGDAAHFVSALRQAGWLDDHLVHDWIEYTGLFLTRKYSSGNVERLKAIWAKHGYKYGKGKGKYAKHHANSQRTGSEHKAKLPNLTQPNLTQPDEEERRTTTSRSPHTLERDPAPRPAAPPGPEQTPDPQAITDLPDAPDPPARNYRADAREVLEFLNAKTGKHFRPVEATLALIAARLRGQSPGSAVEVQTCKSLIAKKARDWLPDEKMHAYLRPETLFNRTKFESYLGELTSCPVLTATDSSPPTPRRAPAGGEPRRSSSPRTG